ncbi:Histone deacetylase RPD3 [Penicillium atrosanguineum]|uniref:Histone deacetylase RPD3 n=1 Tax=Penicillium atrosanguineum TaxID=1132637 RepID=UPI0023A2009A|nr:Histone deacetylase RPD3 [Penicillium atrosanguineum]KAJ5289921.1 Histone deacetylase RPD3 [Penicillium atrosanguineum]
MPAMTGMPSIADMPGMPAGMDLSCKISMLWNWDTIDTCFLAKSWHVRSHGAFAGSCIGVICLVLVLELLRRLGREYDALILRRARLNRMYMPGSSATSDQVKVNKRSYRSISTDDDASKTSSSDAICKTHLQNDRITAAPVSSLSLDRDSASTPISDRPLAEDPGITESYRPCVMEPYRPSAVEQVVRAFMHMLQFAVAYFIMLLAMYFNGYIIICIFIGAFLGSLIFSWEPVSLNKENDATTVTKCCG